MNQKNIFSKPVKFIVGAVDIKQLPSSSLHEFAFVGRSNVGKSSLINALFNNNNIARTSNTPGRTQQINFFELDKIMLIADLPGYGFAKASKKTLNEITRIINMYLMERRSMTRLYILIDSRRGIMEIDKQLIFKLNENFVDYKIIFTKSDKIKAEELEINLNAANDFLRNKTEIFPISSVTKKNIDLLKQDIISQLSKSN